MEWNPIYVLPLIDLSTSLLAFSLKKEVSFFISSSKGKKWSLLIFEIKFPMLLFFTFVQDQSEMESGH